MDVLLIIGMALIGSLFGFIIGNAFGYARGRADYQVILMGNGQAMSRGAHTTLQGMDGNDPE